MRPLAITLALALGVFVLLSCGPATPADSPASDWFLLTAAEQQAIIEASSYPGLTIGLVNSFHAKQQGAVARWTNAELVEAAGNYYTHLFDFPVLNPMENR